MATKIQPLGQRVLVKRIETEDKTAGGIFLPDSAKEKPQEAKIVALGTEVKVDGEDHLILSESDILGIIKK